MDEMTAEMTRFAELRPSEPTLTAHDLAELRRELFPEAAPPADPPREARVIELGDHARPGRLGGRRWLGAAAAAVVLLGGAGVWMASDRDSVTEETSPVSPAESSVSPAADTVEASTLAVPRIAIPESGWTLERAYEDGSENARAVVFLSSDELDGPWVEVSVVGAGTGGALATIVVGGVEAQVSEFDEGALVHWTTPSGVSLQAHGWRLDAAAMAPVIDAVTVDESAITFDPLPVGATVASPDLTHALGRYAEYGFTHDDGRELQVSFSAGGARGQYSRVGDEVRDHVAVGDERGSLLRNGDGRFRMNLARDFWAWEFNGESFESEQAFVDTVAGITVVDEETWQARLPDDIVGPDDQPEIVADLLTGVPVPDGFDATAQLSAATNDRYQFTAQLSGDVVCAWLDQWFTGEETGDAALQAEAADALATSRDWPMLLEIDDQGGWSGAVWEHADAVNGGEGVMTGNGPVPPYREEAVGALGCTW